MKPDKFLFLQNGSQALTAQPRRLKFYIKLKLRSQLKMARTLKPVLT